MSTDSKTVEFDWRFNRRLMTQHLGHHKYATVDDALAELVANSFGAGASEVSVEIVVDTELGDLGTAQYVEVRDNGKGMSLQDVKLRFMEAAVPPLPGALLARFGVGRFAVHRIGRVSEWTSHYRSEDGVLSCITFRLTEDVAGKLCVTVGPPEIDTTGTVVRIYELKDQGAHRLSPTTIGNSLLAEFYVFLLSQPKRSIIVNSTRLDIREMVQSQDTETIEPDGERAGAELRHLMLRHKLTTRRGGKHQIWLTAQGRTVQQREASDTPSAEYVCLVTSSLLDKIVAEDRRDLIEMDPAVGQLVQIIDKRIAKYTNAWRESHQRDFIQWLRGTPSYPYSQNASDPVAELKQRMFDMAAQKLHEQVNLKRFPKKTLEIFVRLLRQAMESGALVEVLEHLLGLTPQQVDDFRDVLKETTLSSIISLSSEVARRLAFLDTLHVLVYGEDYRKRLKERTQLHRILAANCWLFDDKFHLATSDRSFRSVIRTHREQIGLSTPTDEELRRVKDVNKIPDLFMTASRSYSDRPKHRHLVVEIKAPRVTLGEKEFAQIDKYHRIIVNSNQFDRSSTTIDLYLVSGGIHHEYEYKRETKPDTHGFVVESRGVRVWAFTWAELIARAKSQLEFVRKHVMLRTKELDLDAYLAKHHPDVAEWFGAG